MQYSAHLLDELLDSAGAQDKLTIRRFAHLIGGCRMGTDPATSVVDADQRTWAVPNLFVADGSVCPTQGAANPALTIMALASRLGERLGSRAVPAGRPAE
jgi:choline dehydrogenase-like flavoprotein